MNTSPGVSNSSLGNSDAFLRDSNSTVDNFDTFLRGSNLSLDNFDTFQQGSNSTVDNFDTFLQGLNSSMNSSNTSLEVLNSSLVTSNTSCIICTHEVSQVVAVLQIIFGFSVLSGNLLTLILLVKCTGIKRTIRLSLINLAVTDILLGGIFMYHYSVVYNILHNAVECRIRYIFVSLLSGATLTTVTILSFDRLLALKIPFLYQQLVNSKTMGAAMVVAWLCPLIVVCGAFPYKQPIQECNYLLVTDQNTDIVFAFFNLVMILMTVVCHVIIYIAAREQIQKIIPTFIGTERRVIEIRMNLKAALSTTIIILPYIVFTTPFYVFFLVVAIKPELKNSLVTLYIVNSLYNLTAFTSLINPLIYAWKVAELRQTFRKMLNLKVKKGESSRQNPTNSGSSRNPQDGLPRKILQNKKNTRTRQIVPLDLPPQRISS